LAYENVKRLSESEGPIQVMAVGEITTLFPMVVFDPEEETNPTGFSFDVVGPGVLSLARMSSESVQRWLQTVYVPIKVKGASFNGIVSVAQALDSPAN